MVLVFLLVTACGKSTQSQNTGLVVVDSSAAASAVNSGNERSSAPEEGTSSVSDESSSAFPVETSSADDSENTGPGISVTEDGWYTSKEEVAAYLHRFGHLPSNYITKSKAKRLGWDSSGRNLWEVAPGMSIGGGPFGNYEGILPDGDYRECDIDFDGKKRGVKRIVYSDDGRIYYTEDHYETFERLY